MLIIRIILVLMFIFSGGCVCLPNEVDIYPLKPCPDRHGYVEEDYSQKPEVVWDWECYNLMDLFDPPMGD